MRALLTVLLLTAGCLDSSEVPPLPSCASLGCPVAPSGTEGLWSPCDGEACYCRDATVTGEPDTLCAP